MDLLSQEAQEWGAGRDRERVPVSLVPVSAHLPRQEILSRWNSRTLLTTLSFIYLFTLLKYFLGICYVPGSVLGAEKK